MANVIERTRKKSIRDIEFLIFCYLKINVGRINVECSTIEPAVDTDIFFFFLGGERKN